MNNKKAKPFFSIIVPSFNQGQFLEDTLLSIINQDYLFKEIIVIDGGSTDNSVDILQRYNDSLAYWVSEQDEGTWHANNKGLAIAKGNYWMVINSDDKLVDGALTTISSEIRRNPNDKWFSGTVNYINESNQKIGSYIPKAPPSILGYSFLSSCWISHPTVCLSMDVYTDFGGFQNFHFLDLAYWLRLEKNGLQPKIIPKPLAELRLHDNCKSKDRIKLIKEQLQIIKGFAKEENLLAKKPYIRHYRKLSLQLSQMQIQAGLVEKKVKCIPLIIKHLLNKPSHLKSRWMLGAIKRLILPIKINDPLRSIDYNSGTANWGKNSDYGEKL